MQVAHYVDIKFDEIDFFSHILELIFQFCS